MVNEPGYIMNMRSEIHSIASLNVSSFSVVIKNGLDGQKYYAKLVNDDNWDVLMAVAKADGDITRAQKDKIIELFNSELNLNDKEAQALYGSSVHIFGRGDDVLDNPSRVLARTIESFTDEQVRSVLSMLDAVANVDDSPSEAQTKLIKKITKFCITGTYTQI